ncbi:hypothetical protein A3E73_01430 [Candidatus Beckwithbacteria bacterium RIFCSPHIGHO2_12_FULL_47_17]|uniref:Uncharacterized protein n=1 Tax=Candidatus Beckwithbacteria bacterium RIFCSPHIGHO2_12_FULL_47_17 TaxID=1797460 RepID=A0A1F5DK11_9BACT|nr:MAG: hypothetical protein A3E73_01430 [Candidatus Beckwithbacteria bacterium RIFCSPHIGHO2_12_FULL_47_17]
MANINFSDLNEEQKRQLKKIALARTQVMPNDVNVSIGGTSLTKDELIKHIDQEDQIGEQLMLVELEYLQDLVSGTIYKNE